MKRFFICVLLAFTASTVLAKDVDCEKAISTLDINHCLSLDLQVEEKRLAHDFANVLQYIKHIDEPSQYQDTLKDLQQAQVLWQQFIEKDCSAVYNFWRDGTIRGAMHILCKTKHTKERVNQLEQFMQTMEN